jgi:hypothetical protein
MAGVVVQQEDFVKALDQLQAAHSDTIGAPKVSPWTSYKHLIQIQLGLLRQVLGSVTDSLFRYNWGS